MKKNCAAKRLILAVIWAGIACWEYHVDRTDSCWYAWALFAAGVNLDQFFSQPDGKELGT